MHTSDSNPIRLDFVPVSALGLRGRVGMTFAPGKKAPGVAGTWDRSLAADLQRLQNVYRVGTLVSLVEDHELASLGIAALPDECAERGIDIVRFPIPDGGVPASREAFAALVGRIVDAAGEGRNIAVHCRGGLGRTGLVAAACLVARGHAPDAAIAIVRAARARHRRNPRARAIPRRVRRARTTALRPARGAVALALSRIAPRWRPRRRARLPHRVRAACFD